MVDQRGRFSARYWRLRFADDTAQRLAELEDDWDYDWCDDCCYREHDPRQSALDQVLAQLCIRLRGAEPFHVLPLGAPAREHSVPPRSEEPIETRLVDHVERITTCSPWLAEHANAGLRELEAIAEHHFAGELVAVLALALFQPFWLRSPSSWRPGAGSLVEHLLIAYPTPRFLHAAAHSIDTLDDLRWMAYLIVLGQGGSLRRLTELANRRWPEEWAVIPHKLVACLGRVNEQLFPAPGLMTAEVLRLGGNEVECRRMASDPSFIFDPSENRLAPHELEFWRTTVGWLIRHRDELDDLQATQILGWARHLHTERRRMGEAFDWRGRTAASAWRETEAYRQSLYQYRARTLSWQHHGFDWAGRVADLEWSICELTTSLKLEEESQAMSHCVRGYDLACFRGSAAIFSLRQDGRRRVTIELALPSKRVVQTKRACNQEPSALERSVIERWATSI
jgi:hypothetical protein